jgi:poly-gamma-glutamate capsule biosynthesis protein CapA/YwtB (metallophosphatase superfamily)
MPRWSAPVLDAAVVAAIAVVAAFASPRASGAAPKPQQPAPKVREAPPVAASALALIAEPKPAKPKPLVIVAGGDVNFGRECGQAIITDRTYDPFREIAPLWRDADLRFVNLESQLSDQNGETQSPRNRLIFTGPPGGADVLARAGIHVVSTANNHAWDYGRSALFETIDNLSRARVANVGSGRTYSAAYTPAVLKAADRSVAVFAVTHVWNQPPFHEHEAKQYVAWARLSSLYHALKKARKEHDLVLLSYHGGAEYVDAPSDPTRRFIESAMDTGFVDVLIGHHPHVPQGVGWRKKRPIYYSLGNFVFAGHDWAPRTKVGYLARLEVGDDRSIVARACPYTIEGHIPTPVPPKDLRSNELREHLRLISTSVGGTRIGEPDERGCWELSPRM